MKKLGHYACLRDKVGQTYPIYACSSTYHARRFIGLRYVLR